MFVAMHDLLLDDTTDVANFPEFADRRTTKIVEGSAMTGFFVDDFSYAELQMLHLKQRLAGRSTLFDGLFSIPSFSEIMYVYVYIRKRRIYYYNVYLYVNVTVSGPLLRAATLRPTGQWASMLNSSTQTISTHKVFAN